MIRLGTDKSSELHDRAEGGQVHTCWCEQLSHSRCGFLLDYLGNGNNVVVNSAEALLASDGGEFLSHCGLQIADSGMGNNAEAQRRKEENNFDGITGWPG